jgi:hypothetical protein
MSRIVAYVPDLIDRSKVAAAGDCVFVSRPADLAALCAGADVVVVDLTKPGVIDVVGGLDARVIASRELMDQARAAGCEHVLARSEFFENIDALLA